MLATEVVVGGRRMLQPFPRPSAGWSANRCNTGQCNAGQLRAAARPAPPHPHPPRCHPSLKTTYASGNLGQPSVQALHRTFARTPNPDPSWFNMHTYSYHSYGA